MFGKRHSRVYTKRSTWLPGLVALWAVVWKEYVIALETPIAANTVSLTSVLRMRYLKRPDVEEANIRSRKKALVHSTRAIELK
jgi:hypothetical protein